ncbi:MAG: alcohol dehydrogenase catalytic domain-containing protein [Planctomycetota bacterium]|nr:alcohol dehydrogenase catalytic domain-containing protein [Planctomycetota bacterium]MDA1142471.1 alcohol dehydrogenase catalytic domain-containing protein [Planctomycetota bacterium]
MKAAFYHRDKEISVGECMPVSPGIGEVRIQVSFCGVCGTDLHVYHGAMDQRVSNPQILGHEMSGEIVELGEGVADWAKGDRVAVRPLAPCNECPTCKRGHGYICPKLKFIGLDTPGAFQSSWTVPAYTLHRLPDNVPLKFGSLVEPIAVACHDVRLGQVKDGERVVVIGGGPIGMLNALVARHKGAEVIVSEVNPFRIGMARSLGFDAVNPGETDLVKYVEDKTNGDGVDVVFEVSGTSIGVATMTRLLRVRGRVVLVAVHPKPREVDLHRFFWRELQLIAVRVYEAEDYDEALALIASGKVPFEKLITDVRPLEGLKQTFEEMTQGADIMKVLLECS